MTVTCGARNRRGEACQCKKLLRGGRCRFHGGMSTGPKTAEGLARSALNLAKWRAQGSEADRLIYDAQGMHENNIESLDKTTFVVPGEWIKYAHQPSAAGAQRAATELCDLPLNKSGQIE